MKPARSASSSASRSSCGIAGGRQIRVEVTPARQAARENIDAVWFCDSLRGVRAFSSGRTGQIGLCAGRAPFGGVHRQIDRQLQRDEGSEQHPAGMACCHSQMGTGFDIWRRRLKFRRGIPDPGISFPVPVTRKGCRARSKSQWWRGLPGCDDVRMGRKFERFPCTSLFSGTALGR